MRRLEYAFFDVGAVPTLIGHGNGCANNVKIRRDDARKVNGVAFFDLGNVRKMHPMVDYVAFLSIVDAFNRSFPFRWPQKAHANALRDANYE